MEGCASSGQSANHIQSTGSNRCQQARKESWQASEVTCCEAHSVCRQVCIQTIHHSLHITLYVSPHTLPLNCRQAHALFEGL